MNAKTGAEIGRRRDGVQPGACIFVLGGPCPQTPTPPDPLESVDAAVVDYKEYAGRPHFTAGAHGWETVADFALEWANRHAGAPATPQEPARV